MSNSSLADVSYVIYLGSMSSACTRVCAFVQGFKSFTADAAI